jgi:hypothetical protein
MVITRSFIRITRSKQKCDYHSLPYRVCKIKNNHKKKYCNHYKPKGILPKGTLLKKQNISPKENKSEKEGKKMGKGNITKISSCLSTLFHDGILKQYIVNKTTDPWSKTLFQGYVFMDPKQKGEFGENLVSRYMIQLGFSVESRSNSGHDRLINGIPTEIKFSLTQKNKTGGVHENCFMINHVSLHKYWDRLIFMGINHTQSIQTIWFSKKQFEQYLRSTKESNCVFQRQQGGIASKNDDYLCSSKNFTKLLTLPFVNHNIRQFR